VWSSFEAVKQKKNGGKTMSNVTLQEAIRSLTEKQKRKIVSDAVSKLDVEGQRAYFKIKEKEGKEGERGTSPVVVVKR
jgi:hypothetical protein